MTDEDNKNNKLDENIEAMVDSVFSPDVTGMAIYLVKEGDEIDVRGIGQIRTDPDKDDLSAMVFMDAVMFYARHLHEYPDVLRDSSAALKAKVDNNQRMFGDEDLTEETQQAANDSNKHLH